MSTAHWMRAGSLARPSLLTFYFAWAPPLPPQRSEHEANTERLKIMSTQMRHREGGWPKDVDCTEPLDVNRYRKKAEKDDDYKSAVKTLGPIIGRCMKQNNTVNIYEVRGAWPLCTACMAITSPRKTAHPASPSLPLSPPFSHTNRSTSRATPATTPASRPRPRASPCSATRTRRSARRPASTGTQRAPRRSLFLIRSLNFRTLAS